MFQFMTSSRIIFGEGALENSLSLIKQFGYSVLLVSGKQSERARPIIDYLNQQKLRYQHVSISGEPNITMVEETAIIGRRFSPNLVVAIGGGSVLDMGKALAAIIPNQGNVYDYVEVLGRCVPLKTKPLPMIAIPTTASTGSEVTRKAVLKSGQDKVKVSLRSPDMIPDVAIVDPTLTYGTEPLISGRGAMETFTHLMESYVCGEPNPLTDMVCEEGMRKLARAVLPACLQDDKTARADLSFAAMLGGMASTNAKLGAAHGLASALCGKLEAPHSVITARLSPYVMLENVNAARLAGRNDILLRYKHLAELLIGNNQAKIEDGVAWIEDMLDRLGLPLLSSFGVCNTSFDKVAQDALQSNSIKGNPIPLTKERLVYILNQVCECRGACQEPAEVQMSGKVELLYNSMREEGSKTE
ncbi:iron-containing alcohol dehydrogenase [Vibrio diazotrophicus]|uniref:iron-containing alcohol dehydrogenase n=1 Tax=Vibrio diazotrophicus TaxID=685 RepID=UPI00142DEC22|nr:iron-containing alcohol dehydrogenase [Vibrio diazotrophicus]NIY92951.1 iron-containing alcohol dehydrogenase [Vibrio diazotrophicus]